MTDFREQLQSRNVKFTIIKNGELEFINVETMHVCYKLFVSYARLINEGFSDNLTKYSPFYNCYDSRDIEERLLHALGKTKNRTMDSARYTMAALKKMGIENINKDTLNDEILMKAVQNYRHIINGLNISRKKETGKYKKETLDTIKRFEYRIQVIEEYLEGKGIKIEMEEDDIRGL